ncbi:hypothetical protein [Sphingomonas sp. ERG5]|uniref:hypothetical protein n=1 Tax=Sphingomonas sp. ERG5 TaxID=1381597 RepID=UPI000AA7E4DD|nr:hypothetical protein [Sphingomonas sp. ERG5]
MSDHVDLAEPDILPTADQAPPRSPVDDLIPGAVPPDGFDPLADGILMQHQKDWIADQSPLKLARKGRRTGITFAEAIDSTLIGAAAKSAGGDSTFYIGDTKEKGRAFVAVCATFARSIAKELLTVEDFVFDDVQPDGSSKGIAAYRIRFASGNEVVALSSNPANIRGLQGRVVIDEAAFHRNVAAVIDACNALLIWGGVIRIISTHNGTLNAFNELIRGIEAGDFDYSIHTVTFDDAVANGLYERVCLMKGDTPTIEGKEAWYRKVRRSYGSRIEAMREELDVIPREGEGVLLPLAWIEACSSTEYVVLRWAPSHADFVRWPESARRGEMHDWLYRNVLPIIQRYAGQGLTWFLGEDFAMRQDRTALILGFVGQDLKRHVPLIVELRTCPYDQQKQALFWILDQIELIGSFRAGILDANGNGMVLAQESAQKFGARIVELMPSDTWRRETGPRFRAAFEDGGILIPADIDVRNDLRQLQMVGGVAKMPAHVRNDGTDGGKRHGDAAIGLWNFHAATKRGDAARWTPMNKPHGAPGKPLESNWIPA